MLALIEEDLLNSTISNLSLSQGYAKLFNSPRVFRWIRSLLVGLTRFTNPDSAHIFTLLRLVRDMLMCRKLSFPDETSELTLVVYFMTLLGTHC